MQARTAELSELRGKVRSFEGALCDGRASVHAAKGALATQVGRRRGLAGLASPSAPLLAPHPPLVMRPAACGTHGQKPAWRPHGAAWRPHGAACRAKALRASLP